MCVCVCRVSPVGTLDPTTGKNKEPCRARSGCDAKHRLWLSSAPGAETTRRCRVVWTWNFSKQQCFPKWRVWQPAELLPPSGCGMEPRKLTGLVWEQLLNEGTDVYVFLVDPERSVKDLMKMTWITKAERTLWLQQWQDVDLFWKREYLFQYLKRTSLLNCTTSVHPLFISDIFNYLSALLLSSSLV